MPPVLASGDDTVGPEAAEVAPGVRSVVVKHALGARAAAMLHPVEACDRIERGGPEDAGQPRGRPHSALLSIGLPDDPPGHRTHRDTRSL
ncbi:M55 family metallopeptidase [Amycolatopsis echigonensis]|uniref:M55 family metallopeptidase n=1 Tax=Amycolatopsis echigonensis TaxID=2576905 RepID=A0A8E1VZ09_9PSEU|nr:M55 family metallopeptidase [Amycolatopsis echigonensis]